MKVRVRNSPLRCDGCGHSDLRAVVDAPGVNGGQWGFWCKRCVVNKAVAHWRTSTITTMVVRDEKDVF
jgi:hypothetical protein